jgi:toxin ParE1/3/4
MRVLWTVPAAADLESIKNYLDLHFPKFSESTVHTIYDRARALKSKPEIGRPGHRRGTRELPLAPLPYFIVYRVKVNAVEILHVYHGAQDWM